jgi:hypothetical protein
MLSTKVLWAGIAIVAGLVLGTGCTSLGVGKHDIATVKVDVTNVDKAKGISKIAEPRETAKTNQACSIHAWILGHSERSNRGLHELCIVVTNNGSKKECLVSDGDEYRAFLIDENGVVFMNPNSQQKMGTDIVFSCSVEWLEPKQSSDRQITSIEGILGTKPPVGSYTVVVIRKVSGWQGQLLVTAPLKITIE